MSYLNKIKLFWDKNPYFFQVVPLVLLVIIMLFEGVGQFLTLFTIFVTLFYIYQTKDLTNHFDVKTREIVASVFKRR